MDNNRQGIDLLFETSWEVCNKVGGIYTVLSSKARTLKGEFKDKLIFVGPDLWSNDKPCHCFAENRRLLGKWMDDARLPEGISARVGRWNVPGKPIAVLVRFDSMYAGKNDAYGRMWELYGVDSLHAYGDYDEACAFSRAAAEVILSIVCHVGVDPHNVVAHFDEWTTGMGLLTLRDRAPEIATVFTTHATSIGRSICGNGKPLYDRLDAYDGDQMALELNMQSKHSLEKAAAMYADCFTTVSDVTAAEATRLLRRKPDVVTPNGFEPTFVPTGTRYSAARRKARRRMLDVAAALTGNHYGDNTFILATSGRLEYRNKGLDMFLDVMDRLRGMELPRHVLAFVLVPGWSAGARPDLRHALDEGIHSSLEDPVLTHILNNYNEDPVNGRIHSIGFSNGNDSGVDVIYVPCYLDGDDGIFGLTYYGLLPGLDGTVFASYYEPWGYTPMESIAFGVPTVTTTLAGFGAWIRQIWPEAGFENCGVEVARRTDSNYHEAVGVITRYVQALVTADPGRTEAFRKAASKAVASAAWGKFIAFYSEAYNIAEANRDRRIAGI